MAVTHTGGNLIKSMYVNDVGNAQEILDTVNISGRDSYSVMVGSVEVPVDSNQDRAILKDVLGKCIENRYVPWVAIWKL